jgi:tetratricopeptide (TPR) repeat protein
MKMANRWILLVPFFCFAFAAQLFVRSENEARVLFSRAQEQWRLQNFDEAIEQFETLRREHPRSEHAMAALWEIATIYYFNLYDISSALYYFEKLASEYPEGERVAESHLKAAEIFEVELNEISKAMDHWERALECSQDEDLRRRVFFKLGDASFKTGQFSEALRRFSLIVADGQDNHLVDQARLRIGSIFQLRGEHGKAAKNFRNVVERTRCEHCRLQGQLGLIESYEHLDRLPQAIQIAEGISESEYLAPMREKLLGRLSEKRKYYEPSLQAQHSQP